MEYNLKLLAHHIRTFEGHFNEEFIFKNDSPINLQPKFTRRITKIDDSHAVIELEFDVKKDILKPFDCNIVLFGIFELDNWEDSDESKFLMKENTTAILFPFLRQAIYEMTIMLNVPPYIMPIINTADLFNENNK